MADDPVEAPAEARRRSDVMPQWLELVLAAVALAAVALLLIEWGTPLVGADLLLLVFSVTMIAVYGPTAIALRARLRQRRARATPPRP